MLPEPLRRFSKRRGPGDQTSGGLGKLLQSDLSITELLVRETIQNSWDAKLEDWTPAYGIRIRKTSPECRRLLDEVAFPSRTHLKPLDESLASPELRVTEVFDRGTCGLNGPIDPGLAARPGEPNNFNSLVFDIGTTTKDDGSGGTFGFGKTAAFEASAAHAVVYWSRCRTVDGTYEHRFIAACLGEAYDSANTRFTGAHWWGDPESFRSGHRDGRETSGIKPLVGEAAQKLGEQLFQLSFGEAEDGEPETGTSMLIIDPVAVFESDVSIQNDHLVARHRPVRSDEDQRVYAEQVARDIKRNLWPKMISLPGTMDPPMIVQVFEDDTELPINEQAVDEYAAYAYGLQRIRSEQGNTDVAPDVPAGLLAQDFVTISLRRNRSRWQEGGFTQEDLFGDRDDTVAGHLHLATRLAAPTGGRKELPTNSVCLMRSKAELVVTFDSPTAFMDADMVRWTGVFKPTPECDRHFANCEPPSHDRWTVISSAPPESQYLVRLVLAQIQRKTADFLKTQTEATASETASVRRVASALRGFAPLGKADYGDVRPGATAASGSSSRNRSGTGSVELEEVVSSGVPGDGQLVHTVTFRVGEKQRTERVRVIPTVRAVTLDGPMAFDAEEMTYQFLPPPGQEPGLYRPGECGTVEIISSGTSRLEIRLEVAGA